MYLEPGISQEATDGSSRLLLIKDQKILCKDAHVHFSLGELKDSNIIKQLLRSQHLASRQNQTYYLAELAGDAEAPPGFSFSDLRPLLVQLSEQDYALASKAYQILHWDRTYRFCNRCGTRTDNKPDERAKLCPKCGFINYPRISPAIIVAITNGQELLLAKGVNFKGGFYSVLAGFVELGETFEHCVHREVLEEVGLTVTNIRYFGSQPWPFPDSLMVGFTAEYAGGELTIDKREIVDAGWFGLNNLPLLPPGGSIARQLIDWFVSSQSQSKP